MISSTRANKEKNGFMITNNKLRLNDRFRSSIALVNDEVFPESGPVAAKVERAWVAERT